MIRHHPQWHRARELVAAGRLGEVKLVHTVFSYHLTDPTNVRNQADIGGGGLYDIGCYAIVAARALFGAEPDRVVGMIDRDPAFGTDRLTSALMSFPAGRQSVFTCSTQLTPYQRVQILGTRGRIEIEIPFNAPPDRGCRLLIDDGDLAGAGIAAETLDICDQYTLQGDVASRVVRGDIPPPQPLEDSLATMKIIDALFRSAATGALEKP